jgi:hypothetical protein
VIGPAGGELSSNGVTLDVPPGALSVPVAIAVVEVPSAAPPGYDLSTPVFSFSPAGTTFSKPVLVTFATTGRRDGASVFWTNGTGYDALATTWLGTRASALVAHFSDGFVGSPAPAPPADSGDSPDAAAAAADATTTPDGFAEDATIAADAAPEPSDGGVDATIVADATMDSDAGAVSADSGSVDLDAADADLADATSDLDASADTTPACPFAISANDCAGCISRFCGELLPCMGNATCARDLASFGACVDGFDAATACELTQPPIIDVVPDGCVASVNTCVLPPLGPYALPSPYPNPPCDAAECGAIYSGLSTFQIDAEEFCIHVCGGSFL